MVIRRRQFNLESLQQSQNYQTLDQKVQSLVSSISQGSSSFEEVKNAILNENEKTREHITQRFQEHEKRVAEEEHRTKFLESLWFSEIHSREETIAEAHRKTFEWIFDKSGKAVRRWDNFNTWLETGEDSYWISGKAGSGKSTLMNFLCQDERTTEALTTWSGTKDVFMPKFFFWSSGSKIQRSLEGLLRSLLWQILNEFSNVSLPLFDGGPRLDRNKGVSNGHNLIGAWTKSRLQMALKNTIRQLEASCCLCFFIDGLDEFEEDDDELIEFVQSIQSSTGVKICLSSRPYRNFEDAYHHSAKLRLQDLTKKDIERFVIDKFQEVYRSKSMTRDHETKMNDLKHRIVEKADGVFLWVSLAVKDQIRGLRNGDGPEMLQQRLALLPSEVEGVYSRILHQIDRPYRQEASHFLRMAIHKPGLSLLDHALTSYKGLEDMLLSTNEVPKQKIHSQCQDTQKRILVTCGGLLEVHQRLHSDTESEQMNEQSSETYSEQLQSDADNEILPSDFDSESVPNSNPAQGIEQLDSSAMAYGAVSDPGSEIIGTESISPESIASVNFVHRTAVEFLENSPGKDFLLANSSPNFDPQVSYVKALLGGMKVMMHLKDEVDEYGMSNVDRIMYEVAAVEDATGKQQINLCELIDRTMSIIDRKHPDFHPSSHWCSRWGKVARVCDEEDEISSSTTSSRPSSRDSFYSAESGSTVVPMTSPSFLGLAASHGLSKYVLEMLHLQEKIISPEVLNYLLFCSTAVCINGYPGLTTKFWILPPELLRLGANPNAIFLGKSIWTHFLERSFWMWKIYHMFEFLVLPKIDIMRCAIAFIKCAADVGSVWTFHYWASTFAFDIQMSALSLIKTIMQNEADLHQIQKTVVTRGAMEFVRCTTLEVYDAISKVWKQYELSEQESREFVDIFEHISSSVKDRVQYLEDQIQELGHRFDKTRVEAPESSRAKIGLAQRSWEGWEGSEWSTFASKFDPGTLGIKQHRFVRGPTAFFDALTSQPESD